LSGRGKIVPSPMGGKKSKEKCKEKRASVNGVMTGKFRRVKGGKKEKSFVPLEGGGGGSGLFYTFFARGGEVGAKRFFCSRKVEELQQI